MNDESLRLRHGIKGPVVVTGHTGFKGAWFTELLQALSIEVAGYSLAPVPNALYSKLNHRGKFHEEYADIRDFMKLSSFISQVKPEVIFHFAAQPLVLDSYKDPLNTFTTNVSGTANLLEAGFRCETVKAIIVVTTDKVYENLNTGSRFKESDPLMGKDPYSASKVGTEQAVTAWRQISKISGGPNLISVRAGNVIGGGDVSSQRLLPDLVSAFINRQIVEIRNPRSTRPWQHVLDPLAGYYLVANYALQQGSEATFNFSNESESMKVEDVVHLASSIWGNGSHQLIQEVDNQNSNVEADKLDLDSSKARMTLKWESQWSQSEAVRSTVEWWKKTKTLGQHPREVCAEEIEKIILSLSGLK